ncbi:hypothetical protein HPULCUR_010381 [Helicostylum pulchrum]|uniref:Uncharacterized protein n=1 Tax=Helicostylum pulchrum TaxID=562976 RepID=A0ABP9YD32_9FUNG
MSGISKRKQNWISAPREPEANRKESSAKGQESTTFDNVFRIVRQFSVKLVANGLYVGTEEGRCSLVKNGSDIFNFRQAVNLLQTLRRSALTLINIDNQNNGSKKHKDTTMERQSTWIPPTNNNSQDPIPSSVSS